MNTLNGKDPVKGVSRYRNDLLAGWSSAWTSRGTGSGGC